MHNLKQQPIWVNWIRDPDDGKVPKNPNTSRNAMSNNPSTWTTFNQAESRVGKVVRHRKYELDAKKRRVKDEQGRDKYTSVDREIVGIGFMFADGVCGIDIDHCDLQGEHAQGIIKLMDTYTEYSPSGEGCHLIFKADISKIPANYKEAYYQKNPHNNTECYISGRTNRFFTYTGKVINNCIVEDRTEQLLLFLDMYMRKGKAAQNDKAAAQVKTTNTDILSIARKAKNSNKFIALFDNGDITAYNNDASTADVALCSILAFYCQGDFVEIDRLFRQSALYRDKWEREDYRTNTINKAIGICGGDFYKPKGKGRPKKERPAITVCGTDGQCEYITVQNVAAHMFYQFSFLFVSD